MTTALAPLSLSPVSNVIREYNELARASARKDTILFLHVDEAGHWARYGIITREDYYLMLDAEFEKEQRKAWYTDEPWEDEVEEPDPMDGWFI